MSLRALHQLMRPALPCGALAGLALAIAGCGNTNEPPAADAEDAGPQYRIYGSIGELIEDGEVTLSRSTGVVGATEELARAPLAGGEFELRGQLAQDGVVWLGVADAEDNPKGKAQFILEPGDIRIDYAGKMAGLQAHGGTYNQQVIASWRDADAYQDALAAYADVMERRKGVEEGDEGYAALKDEVWERYQALQTLRRDALRAIVESGGDPKASLYALQLGGMGGEKALARLTALEEEIGAHPGLVALRSRVSQGLRMREAFDGMKEGAQVLDFASIGLDEAEYRLADSRAGNSFTLIEFWASWCGPCRAENPNLIASYENYGPKGFEVFAFSLDDDRDDWAEASAEDGIPWINTSDLRAYDSPVVAQFGIMAIPMNFLIDAGGVIVARNLRGETLDEKLAELIDGIAPPLEEPENSAES